MDKGREPASYTLGRRRILLASATLAAASALGMGGAIPAAHSQAPSSSTGKKPNIIFVLMDNLGYGEPGCYGGGITRGAPTPRIDQLAVFLGLVNAGMSVLVFLVIVLFTGRQLARLGVPKMNRVYPALEVLTFGILTISPSLPAGVLANISYNPFKYGIDDPVMTMNYNAIRHRFVGRVRVFIDGMIFPLGLASAGLLLLGFSGWLDLRVVAAFGLALSMVLLALHWNIGRQYASGLIEMLRDGAVELDQVDHGLRLPSEQIDEIRAMLAGDPRTALMGLEMAARCDAKVPPDEIAKALAKIPMPQARRILTQVATSGIEARRDVVEQLAETGPQGIRRLAWEHILCEGAATAARAAAARG